jgi:hypothetical protein
VELWLVHRACLVTHAAKALDVPLKTTTAVSVMTRARMAPRVDLPRRSEIGHPVIATLIQLN